MDNDKYYILDKEKKIAVLGGADFNNIIILLIMAGLFFILALYTVIVNAIGMVEKGSEAAFIGLSVVLFVAVAGFCTPAFIFLKQQSASRKLEKKLIKDGQLAIGCITDVGVYFHRRHTGNHDKSYTTVFRYVFYDENGKSKTVEFKKTLRYAPAVKNNDKVLVCYNDTDSVILTQYSLVTTDNEANRTFSKEITALSETSTTNIDRKYKGLTAKRLDIDTSKPVTTPESCAFVLWVPVLLLSTSLVLFLVFLFALYLRFDYISAGDYVGTAFTLMIVFIFFIPAVFRLLKYLRYKSRTRKLLENSVFTLCNIEENVTLYRFGATRTYTVYYIDYANHRKTHLFTSKSALTGTLGLRKTAVAYNKADCVPILTYQLKEKQD